MRQDEHILQAACVQWFRLQYRHLAPLLFAVPNGGARSKATAGKLKAEGVVPGVADLLLLFPCMGFHALCIEMKTDKGRQSPTQKEWGNLVTGFGYRYEVCRSFDEFKAIIENYLKP